MKLNFKFKTQTIAFVYAMLVAVLFSATSCGNGENTIEGEVEYRTIVIDKCEYITKYNGYQRGYMFAHKGNCRYCLARNAK